MNVAHGPNMRFSLRSNLNLLLTLAIAAMITYWVLQFSSQNATEESLVAVATSDHVARTQPLDTAPMAGLFGGSSSGKPPSEIKLVGVIAQGGKGQGVALLSVGGRPAMAYRVGQSVDRDMTLATVNANYVVIENSDGLLELSLPERAPPTGIEPVR
jgi:hypothetical protein